MIILALNYSSKRTHAEKERVAAVAAAAANKKSSRGNSRSDDDDDDDDNGGNGRRGHGSHSHHRSEMRDQGVQTDAIDMGHSHPGEAFGESVG